jgi:hypothetical protein
VLFSDGGNIPQDGQSSHRCLSESGVPDRKHGISEPEDILNYTLVWLFEKVRFTTFGINMSMSTEERPHGPYLIPPNQDVRFRVAEETTNVRCMTRS